MGKSWRMTRKVLGVRCFQGRFSRPLRYSSRPAVWILGGSFCKVKNSRMSESNCRPAEEVGACSAENIRRSASRVLFAHLFPAAPATASKGRRALKRGPARDLNLALARFWKFKSRRSLEFSSTQAARDLRSAQISMLRNSCQYDSTRSRGFLGRRTMGIHKGASEAGRRPWPAKALGQKTKPSQSFSLGYSG